MLEYVPVRFDLYRAVRPHLRWTLQCLVSFADRAGKCWPSVRTLAAVAGLGKSTAARHLAELAKGGILARQRRPGGCYTYHVDSRFLPAAAAVKGNPFRSGKSSDGVVSHRGDRCVPPARTEENPIKKKGDSHDVSIAAEPPLSPAERAERVQRLDAVLAGLINRQPRGHLQAPLRRRNMSEQPRHAP